MTRIISLLSIYVCLLYVHSIRAQGNNDLYLFSLQKSTKGDYHLYGAKYLNSFNPIGYSNQPSFTHDGDILISVRKPGDTQNDIWLLKPDTKRLRRLTMTSAFEYSPRIHPDEEHISFLRKIGNEPLDQQVCKVDLKTGELEVVTHSLKDVGYYTWLDENKLGLFRIDGGANSLNYYEADTDKSRKITTAIGRTLVSDKEGRLMYVHKSSNDIWYIKRYNPRTSAVEIITQTKGKNEDFAMAPDGTLFMGNNNLLYYLNPVRDKEWKELADLSAYGIKFISRLAVSPNGKELVLVSSREKS